jgi:hypothetical protein
MNMPNWLAKTPEMVAMDRWFSLEAGKPELVRRYEAGIRKVATTGVFAGGSDSLDNRMPGKGADAIKSFSHFDSDWLNLANPSSGGNYWPHVPTFSIITWLQQGVKNACQKGLGSKLLKSSALFQSELDTGLTEAEVADVVPTVTVWVCTSPPGTGTIQVDAVRSPSVVQLVIATPWPMTMQSRLWPTVNRLIDEQWILLHGGPDALEAAGFLPRPDVDPPTKNPGPRRGATASKAGASKAASKRATKARGNTTGRRRT